MLNKVCMRKLHGWNNVPQYRFSLIFWHTPPTSTPNGILPHLAAVRCAHDSALACQEDAAGTWAWTTSPPPSWLAGSARWTFLSALGSCSASWVSSATQARHKTMLHFFFSRNVMFLALLSDQLARLNKCSSDTGRYVVGGELSHSLSLVLLPVSDLDQVDLKKNI